MHKVYQFGGLTLDSLHRRLNGPGGEPITITAKGFDALLHLVEHAGETVSRLDLARALWPNVVVEDNSLSQTILAVRRALGETADGPQFILTIPRGGYRFVADVTVAAPARATTQGGRWQWLAGMAAIGIAGAVVAFFVSRGSDGPSRVTAAPAGTASIAAYGHYLKAISLYRTSGGIGVSMSAQTRLTFVSHLDDALGEDARYPAALGWKAHALLDALLFDTPEIDAPIYGAQRQAEVDRLAQQALAGDPALGIAHTTLARLSMYRGRYGEARESLRRALQSNPNDSMVLHYSAMLHGLQDEHAEAIREARRALALDPRNPAPFSPLVLALAASGEHAAAVAEARRMIEAAPTAAIGYVVLARTQAGARDAAAVAEARQALRLGEQFLDELRNFRVDAALSYAATGERADAVRLVGVFREATRGRHVDPALDAMAHIATGAHEEARARLEWATAHRDLGVDPLSLLLIKRNAWSIPELETPQWRELRARLGGA